MNIEEYFTKSQDSHDSPLLKWQIFKGGLADTNVDEFLKKENGTWTYTQLDPKENENYKLTIEDLSESLSSPDDIKAISDGQGFIYPLMDKVRKLQVRPITYTAEKHRKSFTPQIESY